MYCSNWITFLTYTLMVLKRDFDFISWRFLTTSSFCPQLHHLAQVVAFATSLNCPVVVQILNIVLKEIVCQKYQFFYMILKFSIKLYFVLSWIIILVNSIAPGAYNTILHVMAMLCEMKNIFIISLVTIQNIRYFILKIIWIKVTTLIIQGYFK